MVLNQDLGGWDISNVERMDLAFSFLLNMNGTRLEHGW